MKDLTKFTHYAYYPLFGFWISCYYNSPDENIEGTNWLNGKLLDLAVWLDYEFADGFAYVVGAEIHVP